MHDPFSSTIWSQSSWVKDSRKSWGGLLPNHTFKLCRKNWNLLLHPIDTSGSSLAVARAVWKSSLIWSSTHNPEVNHCPCGMMGKELFHALIVNIKWPKSPIWRTNPYASPGISLVFIGSWVSNCPRPRIKQHRYGFSSWKRRTGWPGCSVSSLPL